MPTITIDLDAIFEDQFTKEQQKQMMAIQALRKAVGKEPGDKNFDFKLACLGDICNALGGLSSFYASHEDPMDKNMSVALLLAFRIIQAVGKQYCIDNNIKFTD